MMGETEYLINDTCLDPGDLEKLDEYRYMYLINVVEVQHYPP